MEEEKTLSEQVEEKVVTAKDFVEKEKKILYEHLDIVNLAIVIVCGLVCLAAVYYAQKEVATGIGGGLVGYLSKNMSGSKN